MSRATSPLYAHIVGPNEYTLTALHLQLEIAGYAVLNTFRIPAAEQRSAVDKFAAAAHQQQRIIIGPLWKFEPAVTLRFVDSTNECAFICARVHEDMLRLALLRDRLRPDIIEGRIVIDLSRTHLEQVYRTVHARYGAYHPVSLHDIPVLLHPSIRRTVVAEDGTSRKPRSRGSPDTKRSLRFGRKEVKEIPARKS